MDGFMVALFVINAVGFLVYIPFRFIYLAKEGRVNQKYRLFAVRDELVRLRLDGKFECDEELYDYYCDICNSLIRHTRHLNLQLFLASIQNVTPSSRKKIEDQKERLSKASPEVRAAIDQLFAAILSILRENSTLLRILVGLSVRGKVLSRFGAASEPLGSSRLLAVREYQQVSELRHKLCLPAA